VTGELFFTFNSFLIKLTFQSFKIQFSCCCLFKLLFFSAGQRALYKSMEKKEMFSTQISSKAGDLIDEALYWSNKF
jgi:hypothetical protein